MLDWVARHPRTFRLTSFAVMLALLAALRWRPWAIADKQDLPADVPAGESATVGPVGDFAFVTKDGVGVRASDLHGKVWVVGCFFTCCTESCPQLSAALARLQEELRDEPDVRLVSLTVDPANDTPQKLGQYAETYRAAAERWIFLTGDEVVVRSFVRGQLKLGVETNPNAEKEPGNRVLHSPKLTVIDRRGVIRGYFDGTDPAAVGRLRDVVRQLAGVAVIQDTIRGWGYEPTAFLPAFNAVLNGLCTLLLVLGYAAVRARKIGLHKVIMVVAFSVSTVFLASYLYYHFAVQKPELSRFRGEGWVRPVYFTILISHILLAVVVAVAAPVTLVLGLTDRIAKHKPLARWTLPVWLYVSITGVVVYWMLYRLYSVPAL